MEFVEKTNIFQKIGLTGLLANLHDIVIAFPIIFLALGIIYCFYGRKIFNILNFLIGGFIALGIAVSLSDFSGARMLFISIASFFLGGILGFFVPYLLVGVAGFSIGLALFLNISQLIGVVAGIIMAMGLLMLFRFFLPALTALIGGSIVSYALFEWTGSTAISLLVGVVLMIAGAVYQYTNLEVSKRETRWER